MPRLTQFLLCSMAVFVLGKPALADFATGVFLHDDDQQVFDFTLTAAATVTIQTWSFAGGTNAGGQTIPAGGFAPVLTLFFDPTGFLPPYVDSGGVTPSGCGPRAIDPATGLCLDAYLNENLAAGNYVLVLTEYDNLPLGNTPADGFSESGNGNFTGGPFLLDAGPGFQRTGAWAVDIDGIPASTLPEPLAAPLIAAIAAILIIARIGRKQQT